MQINFVEFMYTHVCVCVCVCACVHALNVYVISDYRFIPSNVYSLFSSYKYNYVMSCNFISTTTQYLPHIDVTH